MQKKAAVLFLRFVPPQKYTEMIWLDRFDQIINGANTLNKIGYLRPGLIQKDVIQNIEGHADAGVDIGSIDKVLKKGEDKYVAFGYAVLPQGKGPADAVLLTYETADGGSKLFCFYNSGGERWSAAFSLKNVPADTVMISAWAFDADTGKAYRLKGRQRIEK
jgi:hypothetical protein